jgi:NAD(P)-dependent dehydrogenase (short-subunit alcohol dehydrogenase family)
VLKLFDLSGQLAIVTGATGHLGRAICAGLAAAGSNLAVCSTSFPRAHGFAVELGERYNVTAVGYEVDLADLTVLSSLVATIHEQFGRIDCLVNNAYFGAANDLLQMTPEEWNRGLAGAVTAAMFMLQACVPWLEESRGNVINIASMYGMVSPNPELYEGNPYNNPINYGVGKAALLQLTRYAAVYLADKGIRVNTISPGPFPSPRVQEDELFIQRLVAKVPLHRIGQPEELKGAVVFLASDAASFITGHNLVVDGGWTIW